MSRSGTWSSRFCLQPILHSYHSSIPIWKLPMVQNRSEPNPWNQCILVWSGSVTFVVWFRFEPVPNWTVATLVSTFPCWGCATHLPFSPKIRKSALFLSEVAPHDFLFCSPTAWLGDNGVASKGIPCGFSSPKGIPHGSTRAKMRAKTCTTTAVKHEQSKPRLHSSGTLLPFPNAIGFLGHLGMVSTMCL